MSPTHRAILHRLAQADPAGCDLDLLKDLGIATLGRQLAKLVACAFVVDQDGIYRITPGGRQALQAGQPAAPPAEATKPSPPALRFAASEISTRRVADLVPSVRNAKTHPPEQVEIIAGSIRRFGFVNPILADAVGNVIAGHGRLLAAELIGMETVPCIILPHLSEAELRAYMLADNRLAELAEWDDAMLHTELVALASQGIELPEIGWTDDDMAKLLKSISPDQPAEEPEPAESFDIIVDCSSAEEHDRAAKALTRAGFTFRRFASA